MTPSNQSEREQALPNILDKYHIVKYENLDTSETDWYELATELEALIESQRTEAKKELLDELEIAYRHERKTIKDIIANKRADPSFRLEQTNERSVM